MRVTKLLLTLCVSVIFSLFIYMGAAAENRPEFDDSSVIILTKPESNLKLFSTGATDNLDSVLAKLGITEKQELMDVTPETNAISLMSIFQNDSQYIMKLTLPQSGEDRVMEAIEVLNESGAVEFAEPNYYIYLESLPDDPYYTSDDSANNYHLKKIGAEEIWEQNIDCSDVKVAVLDSGILFNHEDLADNIWTNINEIADDGIDNDENGYIDDVHGWDFSEEDDNDPYDPYDPAYTDNQLLQGHGTHVSGLVSGVTDNGIGIASLAGRKSSGAAKIVPLRMFGIAINSATGKKYQSSKVSWIVNAINYVKENKIPIASCSWGVVGDLNSFKTAINAASDTLFIFAAGNGNNKNIGQDNGSSTQTTYAPIYPASYNYINTISVAASDANDNLTKFSNYGTNVEIAAPGNNILSTGNADVNAYKAMNGTSQATPLVASAAAVIKAKYPYLTPYEIKTALMKGSEHVSDLTYTETNTSTDSEGNKTTTTTVHSIGENGRLNAYRSLLYASGDYSVISWRDDEGNLVDKTLVKNGTLPTHDPIEKEPEEEYIYKFTRWESEITEATGDAEYTAVFTKTDRYCTVTWKNYDGTVLSENKCEIGTVPVYSGNTPERAANAEFSYTFTGWSPEIEEATGDVTYIAQFDAVKNKYTVKWLNEDGSELKSEQLEYGVTPVYDGEEPTKAATAEYTYTFNGWSPEIVSVTENAEYTAQFGVVKNKYTVKWFNEDGREIKSELLEYGVTPVYDREEPTKAATAEYTFTFKGWSPEIVSVTENAEYTAQFDAVKNKYTVKWLNEDGSELKSEQLEYGVTPVYDGEEPTKAATAEYTYTFNGWSPEIAEVTENAEYTAQFDAVKNKYTVKWLDENGEELKSELLEYGVTPVYDREEPTKAATAEYTFTFKGWSPEILSVTGDAVYTAQFTAIKILSKPEFSVTDSDDGKIIAIIEGGGSEDNPDFYYTTDGTEPSIESNHYTGEFTIYDSATIKAIAVKEGCVTSGVAEADITVEPKPIGDILETSTAINYTGGALRADIDFVNADAEILQEEDSDLEQFCVIIAVYGNNHQLIGLSIGDTGLEKLSEGLTLTADVSEDEDISEVRMLIWNNTIEMCPIRDAKILTN